MWKSRKMEKTYRKKESGLRKHYTIQEINSNQREERTNVMSLNKHTHANLKSFL